MFRVWSRIPLFQNVWFRLARVMEILKSISLKAYYLNSPFS